MKNELVNFFKNYWFNKWGKNEQLKQKNLENRQKLLKFQNFPIFAYFQDFF